MTRVLLGDEATSKLSRSSPVSASESFIAHLSIRYSVYAIYVTLTTAGQKFFTGKKIQPKLAFGSKQKCSF